MKKGQKINPRKLIGKWIVAGHSRLEGLAIGASDVSIKFIHMNFYHGFKLPAVWSRKEATQRAKRLGYIVDCDIFQMPGLGVLVDENKTRATYDWYDVVRAGDSPRSKVSLVYDRRGTEKSEFKSKKDYAEEEGRRIYARVIGNCE